MSGDKKPVSVLVLVHTKAGELLLLERARHAGYWQSVTGSLEGDEAPAQAACRELAEETGIAASAADLRDWRLSSRFEILPLWRDRYAPAVTHNREHCFSLALPARCAIRLAEDEHRAACWLPWTLAADKVFSWTNRDAILLAARHYGWPNNEASIGNAS